MNEYDESVLPYPKWFDGKSINEIAFVADFRVKHNIMRSGHLFITVNGIVRDEAYIRNLILTDIAPYVKGAASGRIESILRTMRDQLYSKELKLRPNRIHVLNGTIDIDAGGEVSFKETLNFCYNRLPVRYDPEASRAVQWEKFLNELLEPEDILTLQEYMGYCLVPMTKAQKMLMIIGKGGEGKSRILMVLRKLLGNALVSGSINKLETNRFALAQLEGALVMIDDDMKLEALPDARTIKTIVTAESEMEIERKGVQSYQGNIRARLIGLGNGTLQSVFDKSMGFYRRQIILTTKPKPKDRVDDPFLIEKLNNECMGIFNWCLAGLSRLIRNGFRFTLSERTKNNLEESISDGNNLVDFMRSSGYIVYDEASGISSRELYDIYRAWCVDNAVFPCQINAMIGYLKMNDLEYGIEYSKCIVHRGKKVRGFKGIGTAGE